MKGRSGSLSGHFSQIKHWTTSRGFLILLERVLRFRVAIAIGFCFPAWYIA